MAALFYALAAGICGLQILYKVAVLPAISILRQEASELLMPEFKCLLKERSDTAEQ